jgi:predicted transcriptional regulator with HTH domain
MLFFAVFLGFVAENLREKAGDRNKEKEYMHSMASDLQSDITDIDRVIRGLTYVIKGHDSLETMLSEVSSKNDYEFYRKLYYANTAFTWNDVNVVFTESTISELKSSGNLRLIQNKALTDSILNYEETKTYGEGQHDYVRESLSKTYFFATDIFDISCYKKYNDFLNGSDYGNRILFPYENVKHYISEKPQLLTTDKTMIKKYIRLVNNEKDQMVFYLVYVENIKQQAIRLFQQIKTQYHFQ